MFISKGNYVSRKTPVVMPDTGCEVLFMRIMERDASSFALLSNLVVYRNNLHTEEEEGCVWHDNQLVSESLTIA